MATRIGQDVKVRGITYKVAEIRGLSHLGSKFFGKCVFTLTAPDGSRHEVMGKSVAHNSRIRPAREEN